MAVARTNVRGCGSRRMLSNYPLVRQPTTIRHCATSSVLVVSVLKTSNSTTAVLCSPVPRSQTFCLSLNRNGTWTIANFLIKLFATTRTLIVKGKTHVLIFGFVQCVHSGSHKARLQF